MFNVAGKLEAELSEISAKEVVNAVRYNEAVARLKKLRCTDYQIHLLEEAVYCHYDHDINGKSIMKLALTVEKDPNWPDHHINAIKHLMSLGYIDDQNGKSRLYWLTRDGQSHHDALKAYSPAVTKQEVVERKIEDNLDVNLGRDGLLATASKLWWVWTHGDEIKQFRWEQWIKEFQDGQEEIDKAVAAILAPRDPIILPPQTRENPYWTEEMQRKQNDLYWMSEGVAFWLNPRGLLADPTPAPDWWTPPLDYQPKVMLPSPEDDIVERSLLAPPMPAGLVKATQEEIDEKYRQKALEAELEMKMHESNITLERYKHEPTWLCGEGDWKQVGKRIWGFDDQDEVDRWCAERRKRGRAFTVAHKETRTYPEMLKLFFAEWGVNVQWMVREKRSSEKVIDEILRELDSITDEHYDYEDWKEEYRIRKNAPSKRANFRKGEPMRVDRADGHFFMVEVNNEVRGFTSKAEADEWTRIHKEEQRLRIAQLEAQKMSKAARIAPKTEREEKEKANWKARERKAFTKPNTDYDFF